MRKLLAILFVSAMLFSCSETTYKTDPQLKESERMAVMKKAETDTTVIIIEMNDKMYAVEGDKVVAKIDKEYNYTGQIVFAIMAAMWCGVVLAVIARS